MADFVIGQLVATRGVYDLMQADAEFAAFARNCFARYQIFDWGDLCAEDIALNTWAVEKNDGRILASYLHPVHPEWKLWIITEEDRSATTLLFPSEY